MCRILPDFEADTGRLDSAVLSVQPSLWLGQALEVKGDKLGACAAYKVVLDHWGNAKPRSVTADKAKERVNALVCPH